ncbi:UNVERIFIED_CONTAM: hypothetical protein FKN15_008040 [Acipenser sinensis]
MIKEKNSLVELVQLFYPHMKECEDVSSLYSTKVLYIFDGLDESRLQLDFTKCRKLCDEKKSTVLDVLLINLIKGDLLPSASLWITSRPAAASHIPYQYISRLTEIQGFEDQQKDEYFRKKFKDSTLAEKILLHVRMLRSVHVMCYVPAFCWIIATVLGHTLGENGNENIPRTLTEVYTHFLLVLLALQNQKHENIEELLKENQEAILNMGKLAFHNLERNNLIFYEDDLRECGIDIRPSSVYSGIFRELFKEKSTIFKETVYSFVHLTVQEYFAALYVFASFQNKNRNPLEKTVNEKFRGIFRTRLCEVYKIALNKSTKSRNGHLDLFLRFLLGLGMKTNQELLKGLLLKPQDKSKDIQKTTEDIKQMIRKTTSPERSINLFHCLSELNDNSLVEEIKMSLTLGNLSQNLSPSDYSALAYVLQMSEDELDTLDLSKRSLQDEGLLRLMPAARLYKRLIELELERNNLGDSGVKLLSAALKDPNCKLEKLGLSDCYLTGDCCEDLASALCTNQSTLRELELERNNLGDSGVKLLSAALKDPNCKLEKLGATCLNHGLSFRLFQRNPWRVGVFVLIEACGRVRVFTDTETESGFDNTAQVLSFIMFCFCAGANDHYKQRGITDYFPVTGHCTISPRKMAEGMMEEDSRNGDVLAEEEALLSSVPEDFFLEDFAEEMASKETVLTASRKRSFDSKDARDSQSAEFSDWVKKPWSDSRACGLIESKEEEEEIPVDPLPDVHYGLLGTSQFQRDPQGHISHLPEELLMSIFSHLPAQDLYQHISVVCQRWRAIVNDPLFVPWKKLYFQFRKGKSQAVKEIEQILSDNHITENQQLCVMNLVK